VDQTFAPGRFARAGFGPRAEFERTHTAHDKKRLGLVELWDLELADEKEEPAGWRAPVDAIARSHPRLKLAERLARTIKGWIGKRRLSGKHRTVEAGDILILLQSRNVLFHALIGALRRQGVPVAGADRLKLQESLIIQDLLALGQFLRLPEDDHTLACLLKSPLVSEPLNDDQLFALAYGRGEASLWSRLPEASSNRLVLSQLLRARETPFELFSGVLQKSKRLILERLGQEAEDAAQEFLTLAQDYEQQFGTSLTGFIDWFASGETEIKREMEQGGSSLRIMTVHGSKGLEAPIVILADAADPPPSKRSRLVESPSQGLLLFVPETNMTPQVITELKDAEKAKDIQERMRLLYVGMTRAADELYICGSLNKEDASKVSKDSWYPQVLQAVGDEKAFRTVTLDDGFVVRRFGAEPELMESKVEKPPGVQAIPDWATLPISSTLSAELPLTASRNSDAFDKRAVEQGIAIHRLAELMADASESERLGLGQRWAKRLKLDDSLVQRLHRALGHPELAELFGPEGQSEVGIEGRVEGVGPISGRIDRMVVSDGEIQLLDFKTNRNPPTSLDSGHAYARQMARYAALLGEAYPRHRIKAALLWTQTGGVTWLSEGLLSQALERSRQEMA
jgi:ATP-dependent helicase/nuclease subunit A